MTYSVRSEATRAVIALDGVDRVAFNEDGSMELLTPAANPTGNKVLTASQMPFTKSYESPEQTISNAGLVTVTHGFGVLPKLLTFYAVCKVAEHGYSIGDVIKLGHTDYFATSAGAAIGFTPSLTTTTIDIRYANNANPIIELNKTTGVASLLTNTSWRLIVRAWA